MTPNCSLSLLKQSFFVMNTKSYYNMYIIVTVLENFFLMWYASDAICVYMLLCVLFCYSVSFLFALFLQVYNIVQYFCQSTLRLYEFVILCCTILHTTLVNGTKPVSIFFSECVYLGSLIHWLHKSTVDAETKNKNGFHRQ